MKRVSSRRLLAPVRRLALKALYWLNLGDITIRHHYTGGKFTLHSFKHRGYWFYGRRREQQTMRSFSRLIRPGDAVAEIGGHIGYITVYLASLVGEGGRVVVFEPGTNNLPYLRKNTCDLPGVTIVECAVADFDGETSFYLEDLSGQNNTMLESYRTFDSNVAQSGIANVARVCVKIPCTTLDHYLARASGPKPSFIKIDVEGAELLVLRGMSELLDEPDVALMVEVTENVKQVSALLENKGYHFFTEDGEPCQGVRGRKPVGGAPNVFCLKPSDPRLGHFAQHGRGLAPANPSGRQSPA
jgi:FkbM family methyltransferase